MISSVRALGDHSAHLKNPEYNAAQLPLTQRQLNEAEAWQAFTDLALVPEHFRLMMANMVQLGSTDIAAALEEVKTAI